MHPVICLTHTYARALQAAILGVPLRIVDIRGKRKKSGLKRQVRNRRRRHAIASV